jgi:hypothetical protein
MTELNNIIESLKLETHQVERLLKLVEGEINNTFQDWYMTNKGLMPSGVLAIRSELYDLASQLTKSLHDNAGGLPLLREKEMAPEDYSTGPKS